MRLQSKNIKDYLKLSKYIDFDNNSVAKKAEELKKYSKDEISLIKDTYEFVRDEIKHSWDVQDKRVTAKASEVLKEGVGICWAKSNLLAALLRYNGIPTGICYQKLKLGATHEEKFCVHALNAVYIKTIDKWVRLDARGNKSTVYAQFDLEKEQLAFKVTPEEDEIDYRVIYSEPVPESMKVLEENNDALYMYLNCLLQEINEKPKGKKQLALDIIESLKREYPLAECSLEYDEAWKLLVSVRLAAQCTDARVNVVVQDLYAKFPDVNSLAEADVDEIEKIVRPCGLGKSKARDISACMKIIRDEYKGQVPDNMDDLLKLPGVGRKSANLIMGDVYGKPAIVTDTHCIRLTNRMGLVDGITDPKKVEMELWKIIPPEEGNDFCHRLVLHGRDVCTARTKPYCDKCCIKDICKKVLK